MDTNRSLDPRNRRRLDSLVEMLAADDPILLEAAKLIERRLVERHADSNEDPRGELRVA